MKRSLFVLLAFIALLTGCEPETYLFVDDKPISFTAEGGNATIDLVANKTWTVSSDNSWCSVSPSSGAGDAGGTRLTVKCDRNNGYDDRSATLTIRCAELTKSVQVSQSRKKTLMLSQKEFSVGDKGGTITVSVQSNVSYSFTIVEGSSWITAVNAKGLSTDTRQFTVKENTTYDDRVGRIRFADGSGISEDVVVRQTQKGAIVISKKEYNIGSDGGTISVELQSNVNYQYEIVAGSTWISVVNTKGLTTSFKQFYIKENTSYDSREGQIRFYDPNSGSSETVVVKQTAKGVVKIEKTQYDLTYEEQVLEISLLENTEYEVKIATDSQGWIKKVDTKGLNTSSFSLSIGENEKKAREGVVYITFASDIITLKIRQSDGILVALDANLFPDANFRQYCIDNYDKNGDGVLSYKEAKNVTRIEVNTVNIYSLQGIEYFSNLQTLICSGGWNATQNNHSGKITTLDVSNCLHLQHLFCSMNKLTNLDITRNTELIMLDCASNELTSIDVSKNTKLTHLSCSNNQLNNLNLANNTALERIDCYMNQLKSVDVTKNTALIILDCQVNQLTSLDVSNNTALTGLLCSYNQLTSLDVANTALTSLGCSYNQLINLDVANNTALYYLSCGYNQLTSLDVSRNTLLETLTCYNTTMTDLYLAQGQTFKESNWYSGTQVHYGAGLENGYEWVDLGLPSGLKWATCNVGANSPEEYGDYFAWGETSPKNEYTWTNYCFRMSSDSYENVTFSKYNTKSECGTVDNMTTLEKSDDAASVNWGGKWRMPTDAEWTELRTNCTWTWTTQDGISGRLVTGPNGNCIFLPAAGLRDGSYLTNACSNGCYWSSSLSMGNPYYALDVDFYSDGVIRYDYLRCLGRSVRPVTE